MRKQRIFSKNQLNLWICPKTLGSVAQPEQLLQVGGFAMGLVRFKKELTYDEFQAIEQINDETLYFISDKAKIFLGSVEYGGGELDVANSASITLDASSGVIGEFVLSADEGNSLALNNGLWAPPEGASLVENATEDNFVAVDQNGDLKDSSYTLTTSVTDADNLVPSAAAVYRSLEALAILWDDAQEDLPTTDGAGPWVDRTSTMTFEMNVENAGNSYFHTNDVWARIHIDVIVDSVPLYQDQPLVSVGSSYGIKGQARFTALFVNVDYLGAKMEYTISTISVNSQGQITVGGESQSGSKYEIIADAYYLLKSKTFPAAVSA
jgi:hypothetical protein